jgi:hypothetical protein
MGSQVALVHLSGAIHRVELSTCTQPEYGLQESSVHALPSSQLILTYSQGLAARLCGLQLSSVQALQSSHFIVLYIQPSVGEQVTGLQASFQSHLYSS